jgi:hypothetical protein
VQGRGSCAGGAQGAVGGNHNSPTQPPLPDLWEVTEEGKGYTYRGSTPDPARGGGVAALPPDREILARFRSGWGLHGLAVEYGVPNTGTAFEHLKQLEKQHKASPRL